MKPFFIAFTSVLLSQLAFAEVAAQKPAETKPAEKPAEPAKPDPLEAIKSETAKLNAERERIAAQIALDQSKLDEKLAPRKRALAEIQIQMEEMKAKLDLAEAERRSKDDPEMMELRRKNERLMMDFAIAKNEVDTEGFAMRKEENAVRRKTTALTMQMELQQKEGESRTYAVGKAPAYPKEPLIGTKLVLSDRTIPLNGVITGKTADSIADRISYFNNRDPEAPIFIVIDDCPGGSVMAGYKILKAMHGSTAPVYTVVKSMAASMAACITTLSKKSFAYPNAIILHHQLSVGVMGNLTQHRENVKELEEWWKRLADPVATKMGITRDEFIKRMYAESSTGDWNEFGDDAQKLKWVDVIVEDIEETALLRDPNSQPQQPSNTPGRLPSTEAVESQDERGKPISLLPRLNPLDAYWLYNPDSYYRMQ
ncbi:MAG: ATP-dependent Clp protease proteolytic subunit [Verrucomicrobia bacterium]|nr:ATP-dependent Clp protease proteolytic subunit [Verrucomicrobiota bacterium]